MVWECLVENQPSTITGVQRIGKMRPSMILQLSS